MLVSCDAAALRTVRRPKGEGVSFSFSFLFRSVLEIDAVDSIPSWLI